MVERLKGLFTDRGRTLERAWPVPSGFVISSAYGDRVVQNKALKPGGVVRLIDGVVIAPHPGIDIRMPDRWYASKEPAPPVTAAADGYVIASGWDDLYGWHVIVEHKEGRDRYYTIYAHLDGSFDRARVGDEMTLGESVGIMGASGLSVGTSQRAATHLHFQVHTSLPDSWRSLDPKKGKHIDPIVWLPYWADAGMKLGGMAIQDEWKVANKI